MIELRGVGKRFDGAGKILDSIDLSVPRGQFCVVLGPSGAGKSTLLRLINGLIAPDVGAIRIDGEVLTRANMRRIRRRIGMVHQHFNLTPRLRVADNVLVGALPALPRWRALLGLHARASRERALALAGVVGLDCEQLGRRAETLSGGQQQRVGIARAFMLEPDLVLADEPVASLDPALSIKILGLIRDQASRTGSTVVCSLHQVELARAFADRIVGLNGGRIVLDAAPQSISASDIETLYRGSGVSPVA
ncbi:MAG: phosphonate ABC transporter ATP-binding protein [Sphingopyxis sp.]|uniref:phosphonate ABC transporter ATP-binding protein n=1 Tax=Sphingopyxis sp. TaxID=1908224 RepID=UPI002ABAF454|nr:phosphonate ABC transporter ATP-binding protein [Sphingopyxis sp.]MDZ3832201.1 phosphonate ABC transporter ATP-binding protein [Sphingopyxis sp.]